MLHDIGETKENNVKFNEDYHEMQEKLEEKRQFLHICMDQMAEFEQKIKNDTAIQQQEQQVRTICKREVLEEKRILAFIRAGKAACRKVVSDDKRN